MGLLRGVRQDDWKEYTQACLREKPRRKACPQKSRAPFTEPLRIFAGVWGAPNKQSERTVRCGAVEWDIRKGYPIPLLADSQMLIW